MTFTSLLFLLVPMALSAGQTSVVFQPSSLTGGPFPNNSLTISDPLQQTRIRISIPSSNDYCDPSLSPSVCSNTSLLNQLDGFSVNPRIMVCFSGPVNTATLASGIVLLPVNGGAGVSINQIIFDPNSNCVFAKPSQILNQQSRYLLAVTDAVQDAQGHKVKPDRAYADCLKSSDAYCQSLEEALDQTDVPGKLISASVFTTMSATSWLEQARHFVAAAEPPVLPFGPVSFPISSLSSLTWVPAQSGLPPQNIPLSALQGVGEVAFGLYLSPNFLNVSGPAAGSISATPTAAPIVPVAVPGVGPFVPVSYHIFLPATPAPAGGYPLVIYGHGLGDNQFGAPTYIASTLAKNGFATLAIEITGHGYGASSVVSATNKNGSSQVVPAPGRGILIPGSTSIGATDGCILQGALAVRDCVRQTAVDLFAMVRTIQITGGLGLAINPSRLYYVGQSLGGTYGTLFHAVDPTIRAAVLNGDGGTSVDVARLSLSGRPLAREFLASVNPALFNVPPAPGEAYFHDNFNDNYVFRDLPPVVNTVPGAMAIQAAFEAADWLNMLGDPLSFAPHLHLTPLQGVPPKPALFQFGFGDLEVPNPTEAAVIRAADDQATSSFLHFEVAAAIAPDLVGITYPGVGFPILPHRVLSNPTIFEYPDETSLSLAEQQQAATYFLLDGKIVPPANLFLWGRFFGYDLFQQPAPLPNQLNYFQLQP